MTAPAEPTTPTDPAPTDPAPSEPSYPANTAPADMTADQRAAYYKDVADKHEKRARGNYAILNQLGIKNSDDAAAVKARLDAATAAERERETDLDKRERAARETAEQAAAERYRPMLAETAFRVAIGDAAPEDEITAFLEDLNLNRFIKDDGSVDTAKVRATAAKFAQPAKGTTPPARGPIVPGHNPQGAPTSKPGAAARAWLQTKHGIKVD